MLEFGYCIWVIPNKNHIWNTYTKGFTPHMTIKSHLTKVQAEKLFNSLKEQKIKVKLTNLVRTSLQGFNAIEYKLDVLGNKPDFWPENAHISFRYRYNKPFSKDEEIELKELIKVKEGYLENIKINKCDGHYETWTKY